MLQHTSQYTQDAAGIKLYSLHAIRFWAARAESEPEEWDRAYAKGKEAHPGPPRALQAPIRIRGRWSPEDNREEKSMITIQSPDGFSDFYAVDEHGIPCGHKHSTADEAAACVGLPPAVNVTGPREDDLSVFDHPYPYPEDDA